MKSIMKSILIKILLVIVLAATITYLLFAFHPISWGMSWRQYFQAYKFDKFTLSEEPQGIYSGAYCYDLAVVYSNSLTIYGYDGEVKRVLGESGIKYVALNETTALIVKNDGTVWEWEYEEDYLEKIDGVSDAVSCAVQDGSYGAVTSDGHVYVWGDNNSGQLGLDGENIQLPVMLDYIDDVKSIIFPTKFYTFVITNSGDVYESGWIINWENETETLYRFRKIPEIADISDIYAGYGVLMVTTEGERMYLTDREITAYLTGPANARLEQMAEYGISKFTIVGHEFRLGQNILLGLSKNGRVYAWGRDFINISAGKRLLSYSGTKIKKVRKAEEIYGAAGCAYAKKGLEITILKAYRDRGGTADPGFVMIPAIILSFGVVLAVDKTVTTIRRHKNKKNFY